MLTALLLLASGCAYPGADQLPKAPPPPPPVVIDAAKLASFGALPARIDVGEAPSAALVDLGRMLYYDKRLSKNQDVSCNSCHQLDKYGVDNQPTSTGHKGQHGSRNSPTTLNAAGQFVQFWDGRAADVEAQAKGPVLNPVEMAMKDDAAVVALLKSIPDYGPAFSNAFPADRDPITFDNMAKAIGAFERGLTTPAKWDRFLAGDTTALTDAEKKGFLTFVESGCTACHAGPYVGGAMYQKLGLVKPWPSEADVGRAGVTKNDADKLLFKVPQLRNVTQTAPYFHDGSVATLEEAVKQMGEYQLGKQLTDAQVAEIVTWLGTLTAAPDAAYVKEPALPPSGPRTIPPDPA